VAREKQEEGDDRGSLCSSVYSIRFITNTNTINTISISNNYNTKATGSTTTATVTSDITTTTSAAATITAATNSTATATAATTETATIPTNTTVTDDAILCTDFLLNSFFNIPPAASSTQSTSSHDR